MYGLPPELVVTADGPIRVVTLNRPADLNGVNRAMHQALARCGTTSPPTPMPKWWC